MEDFVIFLIVFGFLEAQRGGNLDWQTLKGYLLELDEIMLKNMGKFTVSTEYN
jgi:hypothetical protein